MPEVFVVPAGWSWKIERAIRREIEDARAQDADPANEWKKGSSPERIVTIVDTDVVIRKERSAA